MGLHAVIYDKLDQYTTKEVKVIFSTEISIKTISTSHITA